MFYNKKVFVLVLSILTIVSVCSVQTVPIQLDYKNTVRITTKLTTPTNNGQHTPINITNNAELASIAQSGNGTNTNPYIIANLIITGCNENKTGVNIQNTNKYFVLQNITVSGCMIGISLSHVEFGSITDSYVTNYIYAGFFLNDSSTNTLQDNSAFNGSWDEYIPHHDAFSFNLINSSNNNIINNTASFANVGIELYDNSCYNKIINNTVNLLEFGFVLSTYSNYNYLMNDKGSQTSVAGFQLYNYSSDNILTDNIVTNYYLYGFHLDFADNNNSLLHNLAINGGEGYSLAQSNNTVLKNNIGIYNLIDYDVSDCSNTSLINNKFVIMRIHGTDKTDIVYSFPLTLFSPITILTITCLLGVYSEIGYNYYTFKKTRKGVERARENLPKTNDKLIKENLKVSIIIFSLLNFILVTYSILPGTSYISVNIGNGSEPTYNSSGIFQLAPLSGILLLGGVILSLLGVCIYSFAKSLDRWRIAKDISLIGLCTQTIGFILSLLVYVGIKLSIFNISNSIKVAGKISYTTLPSIGLGLCIIGVLFALFSYIQQRDWNG